MFADLSESDLFRTREGDAMRQLQERGALVVVRPPSELEGADRLVERAVAEVGESGGALTPALLGRIAELSGGRSLEVNVELVVNNARLAAECAVAWAAMSA